MELFNLWLIISWELGDTDREQTRSEKVRSAILRLVLSTTYWLAVAAALTAIVSRLS